MKLSLSIFLSVFFLNFGYSQEEYTEKIFFCEGDCIEIGIKRSRGFRYEWKAFGRSVTEKSSKIEVCPDEEISLYYVNVYNKDGELTAIHNYRLLLDSPNITVLPTNPFICDSTGVTLKVNGAFKEVNWSNGTVGDSTMVYQPAPVKVEVITNNGCQYSEEIMVRENKPSDVKNFLKDKGFFAVPVEIKKDGGGGL